MSATKRTYEDMLASCQNEGESNVTNSSFDTMMGALTCAGWSEEDIPTASVIHTAGKKISKVSASFNITIDGETNGKDEAKPFGLEGKADVEYLMHYSHNDSSNPHASVAEYNGLMKVTGKFKGKEGSFICQDLGKYGNMKAESLLTILPNSGTDGFAGISGYGESISNFGGKSYIKLMVSFPAETKGNYSVSRKEIALSFLKLSSEGKVDDAYLLCDENEFKHHNIHFSGDMQALKQGMKESHEKMPNKVLQVKKVLQDDDQVATYSIVKISEEMTVMVSHVFRFNAANRIVELWDLGQIVPEKIPNENGPF